MTTQTFEYLIAFCNLIGEYVFFELVIYALVFQYYLDLTQTATEELLSALL